MRYKLCSGLTLLLGLAAMSAGGDEKGVSRSPLEELQALEKAHTQALENYSRALKKAKTDQEREQASKEFGKLTTVQVHTGGFLKLIEKYPNDPVALKAFVWLLAYDPSGDDTEKAVSSFGGDLLRSEHMASVCQSARYYSCPAAERLLRMLLKQNQHRAVQGHARYGLARCLKREAERNGPGNPQTAAAQTREAEQFLEQVVEKYGDLKTTSGTLAKMAGPELFELRHLSVDQVAPEIEGKDLDEKPLN